MVGKIGSWELLVVTSDILKSFSVGLSWIVFKKKSPKKIIPKGSIWIGGVSGPSNGRFGCLLDPRNVISSWW